jgi:hypothetical protein
MLCWHFYGMNREVDIEIDLLTESVLEVSSGKTFKTEVRAASIKLLNSIHKKNGWKFNWKKEEKEINRLVYKLVLKSNKAILLGLISIETREDHVHIHLVEKTPIEFGASKKYEGIGGNLFAFACKYSQEIGFDGAVAFYAKTHLIHHYSVTLGASLIKNQKMFIHSKQAYVLINKYFKDEEK